ncbi:Protein sprT [Ralstonia phage RSP15]|uniref:Protein sprT n=1 Tax=Ralstonia phage RSP15 TaxID=1785960 RepID=UPI00074D3BA9|nr:Protein sprT [Ralstonia phage RSP15]BAU40013.1 Protein sprT [Ralstonia phage RSP15]
MQFVEAKQQIWEMVKAVCERGFEIYSIDLMKMVKVKYYRNSTTAGTANYDTNTLSFNLDIFEKNVEKFLNIVSHEVAHLLCYHLFPDAKQHHGPEWRRIHRALGGDGKTFHTLEGGRKRRKNVVSRHVIDCDSCGKVYQVTNQFHKKYMVNPKGCKCVCGSNKLIYNGVIKKKAGQIVR